MMTFLLGAIVLLVVLMVGLQVLVRVRARALEGRPLPDLPGTIGQQIARSRKALIYFFSPSCGACRAITPRVRDLGRKNQSVFMVDVSRDFAIAQALHVMATPSVIEVADGRVAGFHVGMLPPDVAARFA